MQYFKIYIPQNFSHYVDGKYYTEVKHLEDPDKLGKWKSLIPDNYFTWSKAGDMLLDTFLIYN